MNKQSQKFLIDVIPLARIPLSRQQFFSYVFDAPLPVGSLVSIPLFRRNIEGIVINSRPEIEHTGGFQLKKVASVLEESFMTVEQLELAEKISNYYLTSLGTVLRHFMPKRVHSRSTTSNSQPATNNQPSIILTKEQQNTINTITDTDCKIQNTKYLLFGPASSGKTEVYIHSILKMKQQNASSQFLILLPELTLVPQAVARYGAYFSPDEIVVIHSKISKGELYASWQKIKAGQAKIVIGTRMALFAPFQKLSLVIVDEEQDMSFKQWESNPRYDARKSCEFLAEIYQTKVVFGTATPRIETFHQTENDSMKLLTLPVLPSSIMGRDKLRPDIEIVDMRKEKWTDYAGKKQPNLSLLSLRLQAEITYALSNKLQTILFVNHQGMSSFSICASCKAVLRCPKCDRAVVFEQSGEFKCLHCNYTSGAIASCKSCKGIEFKNIGIGTQLVEREVKKIFPSAKVKRLDSAASKETGAKSKVYEEFQNGEIDVLIGTQMITKGWDNPNVGLVGIVDGDSFFTTPDFLTDERAYANIMQTAGRTGRVGTNYPGYVIIQAYNPTNKILELVVRRDYVSFYESQIKQRMALHYPPFGTLIKLSIKDESKTKVEKEAQNVYAKLSNTVLEHSGISITPPYEPMIAKIRGKFIQQIILKQNLAIDLNSKTKTGLEINSWPASLTKVIFSLSSSWSVDVDPISIA